MKLRVLEYNVTLRLHPEEIESLKSNQTLTQSTVMPGGQIEIIVKSEASENMSFEFKDSSFLFYIPKHELATWCSSNKIGFRQNYGELLVVVEKDLPKRKTG